MTCNVLDKELADKIITQELMLFIDGSIQVFPFCPPKSFKPNKQNTWNTSHLHGIAWSSGKLAYDKVFAVFYDIKAMNAEVFAKGIQKCRLLTKLLGQNVEIWMTMVAQNFKTLLEKDKQTVCVSAVVTLTDTKQGFTVPRGKAKVYAVWAVQHL